MEALYYTWDCPANQNRIFASVESVVADVSRIGIQLKELF